MRKNLEQLVYSSHTMTIVSENVKYNAQVVYKLLLYADHIYMHIKILINYGIVLKLRGIKYVISHAHQGCIYLNKSIV